MSQYADCCAFTGAVLVSEHDKVILEKGYGLANREWNITNTPEVKFRLGSITKQFTSMLIMQQVAKGTIKLNGHLSDYLPYYRQTPARKSPLAICSAIRPASPTMSAVLNATQQSITPSTIS
jgi:CubicO group peptidase (beta-lactamase class C family)